MNTVILLIKLACLLVPCVAAIGLWIWMLFDCATKEKSEGNTKIIWILVIVLLNWIGALIYLFSRRPKRIKELGK